MTVIDKVLQGRDTPKTSLTLREAAATVLVASVACDGSLGHAENVRLNALLSSMRLYRDTPEEHLRHLIDAATKAVAEHGVEELLATCADVIPTELRAPLFALAVELIFVDGRIADREKQFVDVLQAGLGIDEGTAMKIISVLLIKSSA